MQRSLQSLRLWVLVRNGINTVLTIHLLSSCFIIHEVFNCQEETRNKPSLEKRFTVPEYSTNLIGRKRDKRIGAFGGGEDRFCLQAWLPIQPLRPAIAEPNQSILHVWKFLRPSSAGSLSGHWRTTFSNPSRALIVAKHSENVLW